MFINALSVPRMDNNPILPSIKREADMVVKNTRKIYAVDRSVEDNRIYFPNFNIHINRIDVPNDNRE